MSALCASRDVTEANMFVIVIESHSACCNHTFNVQENDEIRECAYHIAKIRFGDIR